MSKPSAEFSSRDLGLALAELAGTAPDWTALAELPCAGSARLAQLVQGRLARPGGMRSFLQEVQARAREARRRELPLWIHESWIDEALLHETPAVLALLESQGCLRAPRARARLRAVSRTAMPDCRNPLFSDLASYLAHRLSLILGVTTSARPEPWLGDEPLPGLRRVGFRLLAQACRSLGQEGAVKLMARLGAEDKFTLLETIKTSPTGGRAALNVALDALRGTDLLPDLPALTGIELLADLLAPRTREDRHSVALSWPRDLGLILESLQGQPESGRAELARAIVDHVLGEQIHGQNHQA